LNRNETTTYFAVLYQRQTFFIVLVNGHAIQTLKAFCVIDIAGLINGLVLTAMATGLTGCSASLSEGAVALAAH
jgi:hypothetical protein